MKRLAVTMMLCLISSLLIGCAENTAWIAGDRDAALVRIGTMVTKNNEIGIVGEYFPNADADWEDEGVLGVYGAYHFGDTVQINNPFNSAELIYASSYVGAQYTVDEDYNDDIRPFVGFTFNLDENVSRENGGLFLEYQDRSYDSQAPDSESKFLLGLRFRF